MLGTNSMNSAPNKTPPREASPPTTMPTRKASESGSPKLSGETKPTAIALKPPATPA